MDLVAFVAERKIEVALKNGAFDALPPRGFIDCSLRGEAFFAKWFRDRLALSVDAQSRVRRESNGESPA